MPLNKNISQGQSQFVNIGSIFIAIELTTVGRALRVTY